MDSCPFSEPDPRHVWLWDSSPPSPRSRRSGRPFPFSLAVLSAQARTFTSWRIAASRLVDCLAKTALFTMSAASRRRLGSRRAASCGSNESGLNNSRAIVVSRSSKKAGLVEAGGPSCSVANFRAGPISPPDALQTRINSTSWSRRREKRKALSLSKI